MFPFQPFSDLKPNLTFNLIKMDGIRLECHPSIFYPYSKVKFQHTVKCKNV